MMYFPGSWLRMLLNEAIFDRLFLLTGDASATDPVCELAPLHHLIEDAVRKDSVNEDAASDDALSNDAVSEDRATGSAPEAHNAPFHVLQEKMAGFWSYRIDPK